MTNKERIDQAWAMSNDIWPPQLGMKVRIFQPVALRGRVAKVVATATEKSKVATRKPASGKVRVAVNSGGVKRQFNADRHEIFPHEYSVKQLMAIG